MKKNGGSLREIFEEALNFYNKKDFKTSEIYCYKILNIKVLYCLISLLSP